MRGLITIAVFSMLIINISCKDNHVGPEPPEQQEVELSIELPEEGITYWSREPVPCKAQADHIEAKDMQWRLNGISTKCINGELEQSPAIGENNVSVHVSTELFFGSANVGINVLPIVEGLVFPVSDNGVENAQGVKAYLFGDGEMMSQEVSSNGSFRMKTELISSNDIEFCLEDKENRYYKVCIKGRQEIIDHLRNERFRFVLVPKEWHVKSEIYNEVIDIDLKKAFERNAASSFDDGRSLYQHQRSGAIVEEYRPLPKYFDREESSVNITKDDSLHYWKEIERLERYLGIGKIFTPINKNEEESHKVVRVVFNDLSGPVNATNYIDHAGIINKVTGGMINIRKKHQMSEGAIMHEAIHVMNFGHTCSWTSVMSGCLGENSMRSDYPTLMDVGHIQLYYKVKDTQAEMRAPFGVNKAWETIKEQ